MERGFLVSRTTRAYSVSTVHRTKYGGCFDRYRSCKYEWGAGYHQRGSAQRHKNINQQCQRSQGIEKAGYGITGQPIWKDDDQTQSDRYQYEPDLIEVFKDGAEHEFDCLRAFEIER